MNTPTIQKGIPIPPRSKWTALIERLQIGDSITVTMTEASSVRIQARLAGLTMTSRTTAPNQVSLWRVR
jgi:hypothetical protein